MQITVQAQIHLTHGRYKDAEYLCRQLAAASSPLPSDEDGLLKPGLDIVLIYEKLGNLPAAEILQERRLLVSMSHEQRSTDAVISRDAVNLFRLYILFLSRIERNVIGSDFAFLTVFYRIAILDCPMLNALLFQSELWERCDSEPCLHIAIRIHSTKMIRELISIGVDINRSYNNDPPLLTAARYGNLDSLKLLLANSVDVKAKTLDSETALHLAILRDGKQRDETCDIICNLIEAGVDIEAEDWDKDTALNIAVRRGYPTAVRSLLQQGANIEHIGSFGKAPLFWALRYGYVTMVELLLDHGVNTESLESNSNTPLHQAVIYGQDDMVRMLLRRGASTATRNSVGETPVDTARSRGDRILLDILLGLKN